MKQPLAFLTRVAIPILFLLSLCKGSSKGDGPVVRAGGPRRGRAHHLAAAGGGSALPVFGPGRKMEFLSLAVSRDTETALKRLLSHW